MIYSKGKVCISDLFGRENMYLSLKDSESENIYLPLNSGVKAYDRNRPKALGCKSILVNPTNEDLRLIATRNPYLVAIHDFLIEYVVGINLSYVFDDENETEQRDIAFISLYDKVQKFMSDETEQPSQDYTIREMQMLFLCDFPCIDLLVAYPFKFN